AFVSDAGMCADYDSVIGMEKGPSVRRFVTKMPGEKPKPAEGEASLCGVFVVIDDATGLARRIEPVRVGGRLAEHIPVPGQGRCSSCARPAPILPYWVVR